MSSGTGAEWGVIMDGIQSVCLAGAGQREDALSMAARGVEHGRSANLVTVIAINGTCRARVLRMLEDPDLKGELDAQICEAMLAIEAAELYGYLPGLLLERAGLAKLRGDMDGMKSDLTEARRLFADMGVTGWDNYAASIEA